MKILLGAYACEPNNGSEQEVGWQMANEIATNMPRDIIYVITRANNQIIIESEEYSPNLRFYYYDLPKWLSFWKKGGRGVRTYYYLWMIGAAIFMKKQDIKFDIVHHITFVNDWLPSFFHLLKTKKNKFIWGPIGSHDPIESKFLDGGKQKSIEKFRIFLQLFFRKIDPSFHICKAKADCIIGINENVKKKLNLKDDKYFVAEPAIGMKKSVVKGMDTLNKKEESFIVISVGRLLYIKNFKLTIISFACFLKNNTNINNAKLKIIGDGRDKKSLQKLARDLGVEQYVEFVGSIPLHEVQEHFAKANVFLFPTLENAGFVTLEAMSNSLPVIAMKYGGPEQFVKNNEEEQLVSPALNYDDLVNSISKKIELLYEDNELCKKIGKQNCQDILNNYTW